MPSTKSFQNFAKTSLQKSPICYSFIINRGNKSVEKPLLGKTSSRRFVLRASWHVCEPNDWWTTHSVYKTWTISCNRMNKTTEPVFCWRNLCNDRGLVIIHCQPFTSLCNHSVRTVSHKSLLHKLSSTNSPPVLELLSQIKTIRSQFLPFSVKKERDLATLHSPCHIGLPQVRVVKMSSCPQF